MNFDIELTYRVNRGVISGMIFTCVVDELLTRLGARCRRGRVVSERLQRRGCLPLGSLDETRWLVAASF